MSARIAKVTALSLSSFHKRYRSSYETSSLSPTLPVRKRYKGTSELILDTDSEGDELGKEDEEDESSDADDERERVRVLVVDKAVSEPLGLGYEAARRRALESTKEIAPSTYEVGQSSRSVPEQEGVERVSAFRQPTLVTWVDLKDDRVYTDILAYAPLAAPVQTPPSLEWSSGSFSYFSILNIVPITIASPVATLTATIMVDEDKFLEKRATVTFRALWRSMLALEAWAGRVDSRLADMSRDRYDDHRLIHDMLAQQDAMQREL
ncbi:hypothetical protein Tco_1020980 [Tanacetum coccineum]